ncbi:hypothetical protein SIAM614_22152 [Stappia aggregata IAM 12614]|uniref:UPF0311 protein SIAM614_22152 n=1 Tax=Roseibium aggregatum (strain ATCC 25650 / DSM 13394 / JCM 20685 / NBRC 16684 / NCIMB 2208 / IAM 12614 / B1) TaxID=384765 RepID=A0NXY6_ROSAI|nr:DUF3237 domain-containing protein [Roseibium aggregatum]EAV42330.1 hypothetical protein SIAM614_22152 [Stappia aggregata IAM 12614] [Roseibium aggregatum IAM 12614]
MITPELTHFCDLEVELGPVREMGQGRAGTRRIIPIIGGRVSGQVSGTVLDMGADWQTILADGSADIDTRYAFETDDGVVIEIINKGVRHGPQEVLQALARGEDVDPSLYYFRTVARLETGDPRYDWVNRTLFLGTGHRLASAVLVSLFQVG